VAEAVDQYLRGYVDVYGRLGAQWIVVHAGYHFTSDRDLRMEAGLQRLKRLVDYAEQKNALILLENLNKEPADAEVHYLAHTIEEWQWPGLSMRSIRAGDKSRVEEVRLADCFRNGQEIHLKPDAGDLDFADMFRRIEGKGFTGHYMNAFGSLDDMLAARDDLARHAEAAG
jgi:sugar phosphate isomerase/epimerase